AVGLVGDSALLALGVVPAYSLAEILIALHAATTHLADRDELADVLATLDGLFNRRAFRQILDHGLGADLGRRVLAHAARCVQTLSQRLPILRTGYVVVHVGRLDGCILRELHAHPGRALPIENDHLVTAAKSLRDQRDDAIGVRADHANATGFQVFDEHQQR